MNTCFWLSLPKHGRSTPMTEISVHFISQAAMVSTTKHNTTWQIMNMFTSPCFSFGSPIHSSMTCPVKAHKSFNCHLNVQRLWLFCKQCSPNPTSYGLSRIHPQWCPLHRLVLSNLYDNVNNFLVKLCHSILEH